MSDTWIRFSGCLGGLLLSCAGSVGTPARGTQDDGNQDDFTEDAPDGAVKGGDGSTPVHQAPGGPVGSDGSVPQQPPPTPILHDCSGLAAEGVFEEITPPEVKAGFGVAKDGGGTFAIAVDPVNQGTLYVGTLYQKVWKTTDCGATWAQIAKGKNGAKVDSGMNWTFAVDPQEPNVVYTNSGYGDGTNGLYKSTNGGVDWDVVWPPPAQPELAKSFTYNFVNVVEIDPSDHKHLLLTFHEVCHSPNSETCIAESRDAGATWRLLEGQPNWNGNEGQVIFFLDNSQTWLWGSQVNGFWRSPDSGATWQVIPGMDTTHLQGSQLVRTQNGSYFVAAADGIWRSPDGLASTWKRVPDTGSVLGGLVTNGSTMFASTCYFPNFCRPKYLRSSESDGQKWSEMNGPDVSQGGTMAYDKGHKLLYSANLRGGLWRVVAQ